jgi:hypothetical protein
MERSEIRDRAIRIDDSRIALRSIRATVGTAPSGASRDDGLPACRHCEERSDEAIHVAARCTMDCFATLAMTVTGR